MTTVRVRFDGKVLIPQEPVDLPIDRELHAQVSDPVDRLPDDQRPGSPAAILRLMREGPHVAADDVDELERAIAEGQSPAKASGVFDDLRDRQ